MLKLGDIVKRVNSRDLCQATLGLSLAVGLLYLNGGWSAFRSPNPMSFMEYYLVNDIALLLIPAIVIMLCGLNLSDYGIRACSRKHTIVALIVGFLFFPIVYVTAKSPDFQEYYLQAMRQSGAIADHRIEISLFGIVRHLVILASYMFAWEWFFRGYLLISVQRVSNSLIAVLVQAAMFTVMHFGKPTVEVISSFFGAILLGIWALRCRSIMPCFIVHALLTTLNDVAVLLHAP